MLKKHLFTRKHGGEEYKININLPQYTGEKGIFGVDVDAYISIETPENCLGYTDTVLFSRNGKAYTLNRYLQPYILKALERQTEKIRDRIDYYVHEFYTREEWAYYVGNIEEWEKKYNSLYPDEKIKYAIA